MIGSRQPSWSHMLLDRQERPLGLLDGVTGGGCEVVARSPLGGSATLTLDKVEGQSIDWLSHRVQTIYDPGVQGVEPWPVGTYLFTSPTERHTAFGLSFDVDLQTKMIVLDRAKIEARWSLPPGAPVIPAVVDLIQSTGETRISVTGSDVSLPAGFTRPAGTSKREIINDLLTAVGYWSLWCDGSGTFRVEPYVDPRNRPVSYVFEHGEASVHAPDWSHRQDLSSVPNMFIARGEGDEDSDPLVGVAKNEDPDSPFSFQNRDHQWFAAVEENVEAASQEVIDQYAARRLLDLMNPVSRLDVVHAMLPLNPDELVSFTPRDRVRRLATIQRMSMRFAFDTDVRAEWRQV